jgi:hypothetical protein
LGFLSFIPTPQKKLDKDSTFDKFETDEGGQGKGKGTATNNQTRMGGMEQAMHLKDCGRDSQSAMMCYMSMRSLSGKGGPAM